MKRNKRGKREADLDSQEKAWHRAEIAKWLRGILAANPDLTPTRWSLDAGVTRATVGRALSDKHDNVLSVVVLYKLARAVRVPPPLELGLGAPGVPSPPVLAAILRGLLSRIVPDRTWSGAAITAMAQALRLALAEAAESPELASDAQSAELLGRMAALPRIEQKNSPDIP